jgi:type I restriction enzyme S subunit
MSTSGRSDWKAQRLKYNSYIRGRVGWQNLRAAEFTDEGPYLVTGMHFKDGSVDWNSCYHISNERYGMAPEIQIENDDLLITKDGTIGKLAHVCNLPGAACLNSHLLVIRPLRGAYLPRFLFYLLSSAAFQEFILQRQSGTTFFGLTQESIENFPALLPSISEQRAIADFLDRETRAFDEMIAKGESLLRAVIEAHEAAVTRKVTDGSFERLKPGATSSVVQFALPSTWNAPTVRALLMARRLAIQDGNHGELHPVAADYVLDGIPFIMASDLRLGEVDLRRCKFISEERARALRIGFAQPLDILMSHKGTLGAVAMVPENLPQPFLMLTPQVTYYRIMDQSIKSRYLYHLLSSQFVRQQLEFLAAGQATRPYVGIVAQRNLVLPLPPGEQQELIAAELDASESRVRVLAAHLERRTELLREQKSAIISAAVSGQIDVRNFRPQEAAALCQ